MAVVCFGPSAPTGPTTVTYVRGATDAVAPSTVWAWGDGQFGGLGNGACDPNTVGEAGCPSSAVPVKVQGLTDVVAVADGFFTAYALRRDGTVWSWGNGAAGALGDGNPRCRPNLNATFGCPATDVPVEVKGLGDVVAISAGAGTTYAVRHDGTVWAWGSGRNGELGDGNPHCTARPMLADNARTLTCLSR